MTDRIVASIMYDTDPFGDKLPVLETERLRLRHPRKEDVDELFVVFSDPAAMCYWSHEPWTDLEVAQKYLADINSGFEERTLFQWAITFAEEDRLIGTVTLLNWDKTNRHVEVGFMLSRKRWGKGLATEAVRAVLHFAFEHMNVHRVEAELDPRNEASARLLERLGFKYEGLLRERWFLYNEWSDSALYGLLRREFDEQQAS